MVKRELRKLVNGIQFLRMGDDWFRTALPNCTDKAVCQECKKRGDCPFFKECHYMFLRDFD